MAVDLALFRLAASIESGESWPRPACPSCRNGYVSFSAPDEQKSPEWQGALDHPDFEPEWLYGTFLVRGECENISCKQVLFGTGDFHTAIANLMPAREYQGNYYNKYYNLKNIHPAILIMPTPDSAPSTVREGVLRASRVILADPGLAATALRTTVEHFMTAEGIGARRTDGKYVNLHKRIDAWAQIDTSRNAVATLFFAVKWIGNAATHEESDMTTTEVLEGAQALDEAFHRLFTGPDIDAYARNINASKGPLIDRDKRT